MAKDMFAGWTWSKESWKKAAILGAIAVLVLVYNVYSAYGVYLSCCQARCDHVTFALTSLGNTMTGGIYGIWEYFLLRGSECDTSTHSNRLLTDANYFSWRRERRNRKTGIGEWRAEEGDASSARAPWGYSS